MASLRRTQFRAACREALRHTWTDKRYGANQAHKHFKAWWREFPKELFDALKKHLHKKVQINKLLTKPILNK